MWPNISDMSFVNLKTSKAESNSILSLLYLWLLEQRSNAEIKLNWFSYTKYTQAIRVKMKTYLLSEKMGTL